MKKNTRFAFLVHPLSIENFYFIFDKYKNLLKIIPGYLLKKIIQALPCFKFAYIEGIKSKTGEFIDGVFILCPLLPEQFVTLDYSLVLRKILKGSALAERVGADILALGGFTSIFSDQGIEVAQKSRIKVTTGNTYTACLAIQGILKAAAQLKYDLKKVTLTIIGATGDIGSACALRMSGQVEKMILVARDPAKLEVFAEKLRRKTTSTEIVAMQMPDKAASEAEIIVTATSSTTNVLKPEDFKGGAIVCDISLPPNVARDTVECRDDVLVFEGGYASLPFFKQIVNDEFKRYFCHESVFGCLAESIILAMEGRKENFSLGKNQISLEKIYEIDRLGKKHGIGVAPFFCGQKKFDQNDIERIGEKISRRLKIDK